jgi:glycosyltransferase involved in cell wall biosynthesis
MKIMVVSPLASHQPTGGAKRRIYNLLWHLKNHGCEIHFVYTCHEAVDHRGAASLMAKDWDSVHSIPYSGAYEKSLGDDFGVDDWIEPGSEETVARLCDEIQPDIVLIQYVFQSYYCDAIPDHIPTVIDAHDKLSRRHIFEAAGIEPGFFYTTEEDETRGLSRADLILSIQDNEASYFERSGRPVVVAGHIEDAKFDNRRFNSLSRIGIVAAYNKFNIRAVEDALPPVLQRLDDLGASCEIHLAGNIVHGVSLEHPKLIKRGFVENVADFYGEMDLILNPTLDGTGLKIKTVEAMAFGLPLISTEIGFDGLGARTPFHAASDGAALADLVEEALRSQFGTLTKLANLSRAIFTEYQHNLERNLKAVFSRDLCDRVSSSEALLSYVSENTSLLGDPDAPNHVRLRDIRVPKRSYRLAHVVNPVDLKANSDLYIAQPVTFESMRRSKAFATDIVDVDLLAVGYAEDHGAMPDSGFTILPDLQRSVLDVGEFEVPRKLPLLADLISAGFEGSDADYLVFTNVDIALTPQFYARVAELIDAGHDAIIINRRTISKAHSNVNEIGAMYAEYGRDHPGYDCFVIQRSLYEKFNLGLISVGVHMIGRVLLWNLRAFARNLRIETQEHLTFHIGDDVPSKDARLLDYIRHNVSESLAVLDDLEKRAGLLSELDAAGERKLLTLNFGPNMFKEFSGGRIRPALARPILIHALFRAGSTYLWRKMRQKPHLKTYYEPFHEDLAMLSPKSLENLKKRHKASSFHKLDVKGWLFEEFESVIESDPQGRVTGYHRAFAYDEFADPEHPEAMRAYVDGLLNEQDEKTPVLQFNRSSLRQNWFRRQYPDALHIYMQRSARGQWGSYAGFVNRGRLGFVRNTMMLAGKNANKPSFAPLASLVPLAYSDNVTHMHQIYDAAYDAYSLEELYTIFYYVWLMSTLMGVANADVFLDTERLSVDRRYQLEIEFELMCANVVVDLSDAHIPTYDPDTLGLSSETLTALEGRVHAAITHSGWPLPIEPLRAASQHALADRLEQAASGPPPETVHDLAARRRDIETILEAELSAISAGTWTPRDNPDPVGFKPRALMPLPGTDQLEYNQVFLAGGQLARELLGKGWDVPQPRHCATEAPVASLEFSLAQGENVSMALRVRGSCETRTSVPVLVKFHDVPLYEGMLNADSQKLAFAVPDEFVAVRGRHTVEIHCATEWVNGRSVGLYLEALEVTGPEPVAPAPVETPVKPAGATMPGDAVAAAQPEAEGPPQLRDIFPLSDKSQEALLYGWDVPEGRHVWTNGFVAALAFRFHHDVAPDWLAMDLATLNELSGDETMFSVRLNGRLVYAGKLWPQIHRLAIKGVAPLLKPGEANELVFETRQLLKPENDHRSLGLRMRNVGVAATLKVPDADRLVDCNQVDGVSVMAWSLEAPPAPPPPPASVTESAPSETPIGPSEHVTMDDERLSLVDGWSYREGGHVWAVEPKAHLEFLANGRLSSAQLMRVQLGVAATDERSFTARLNGHDLGTHVCSAEDTEIDLPLIGQAILENSMNRLEIEALDAEGAPVDAAGRRLVLCVKGLSFEP